MFNLQQPKNHANQPNLDPLVSTVVREYVRVGPPIIVAVRCIRMQDLSTHLVGLYVHDLSPSSVACRMGCQHTSAGVPSSRDTERKTGERKGTLGRRTGEREISGVCD